MDMCDSFDYMFKIVVVGDMGVGKSCFLLRLTDDSFTETHISTIGVDFKIKTVEIDGNRINTSIWDTAGQERFRTITRAYYRGAHCVILVFDVTNRSSFEHVQHWLEDMERNGAHDADKLLVGTKCDLTTNRAVSYDEAKFLADRLGVPFIETSAKTGVNVEQAFLTLVASAMERYGNNAMKGGTEKVALGEGSAVGSRSWCC